MLAAAAVLLFGILSVTLLLTRKPVQTEIIAEAATSMRELVLPDGSKVTLRQGSTLRYNESFVEREVILIGEAFFEVTRDESRPFSVAAGSGNVRVLGTKFNLKALSDTPVELFVDEGQVAFAPSARKFDAKIFSAGQAGILKPTQNAEVERTEAPGPNVTSWINGRLVFDHETLDHVLADISRHFAIPVQADSSLYSCELKADFEHATLDNVLETISFSLNLQVEKSGDTVVISGSPCATETEN
jgi:transmembrane sensor